MNRLLEVSVTLVWLQDLDSHGYVHFLSFLLFQFLSIKKTGNRCFAVLFRVCVWQA